MKAYYSEFVQHCLRFYTRHKNPRFRSQVDEDNWKACERAMRLFSDTERELLMRVYKNDNGVVCSVSEIVQNDDISSEKMWELVKKLEREVAIRRGLY